MTAFILQLVQILQALLTPVIAGVVAYIAWQQWKANRLKLKFDLYDRRLRVYEEVVAFLRVACRDFKPEIHEVVAFARSTAQADFLFPAEIRTYIDTVRKRALDSRVAHITYDHIIAHGLSEGQDFGKITAAMHEHSAWLAQQHDLALEKFRPHLDISAAV